MHSSIMPPGYVLERKRQLLKARLFEERAGELAKASFFGRIRIYWQIRATVAMELREEKPKGLKGLFGGRVIH